MSHQDNAKADLDAIWTQTAQLLRDESRSDADQETMTAELAITALGAVVRPLAAIADHLSTIAVALTKIERSQPRDDGR